MINLTNIYFLSVLFSIPHTCVTR